MTMLSAPVPRPASEMTGVRASWRAIRNQLSVSIVVTTLAAAVLWVAMLDLPGHVATASLDDSWSLAMGHFLKSRSQAGADYYFTYGPLGYFLAGTYDDDLFGWRFAWEVVVKAIFLLTFVRLTRSLSALARLAGGVVLLAFIGPMVTLPDTLYLAVIMCQATFLVRPQGRHPVLSSAAGVAVMAILSLTKFTFLLYTICGVGVVAVYDALAGQPRRSLLLLGSLTGTFLAAWLALGQQLAHVPRYFYASLQVAAGYADAMSLTGAPADLSLALAVAGTLGATLIAFPFRRHLSLEQLTAAVLLGLAGFLQWKNSFVRHDQHAFAYFAFALFIPFVLPAAFPTFDWRAPPRVVLLAYGLLLSAAGAELVLKNQGLAYTFNPVDLLADGTRRVRANLAILRAPFAYRAKLRAAEAQQAAADALPGIQARVGGAAVDLFPYESALVLRNGLNWRPRPVFQSYCAYTPFLEHANATFLASPRAPEYVIFDFKPLDKRVPALEDGEALVQLFHNYQPVFTEKGFLLFRRRQGPPSEPTRDARVVCRRSVRLGQEVSVEGAGDLPERLSLDVRYSSQGNLRRLLHKLPPLFILLRTANGIVWNYRLVPDMARGGFLINPLLTTNLDATRLYGGPAADRVVSFCVHTDPAALAYYKHEVGMTLESLPELVPARMGPGELGNVQYPDFPTRPQDARSRLFVRPAEYEGRSVLLVHPEGELEFAVPAGSRQVSGQFGILPVAYERGDTDGVLFTVEYRPEQGAPEVLYQRFLDPAREPGDRGLQTVTVLLPQPASGRLFLKTSNPPGKHASWDWSFWAGVRVQ